MAEAAKLFGNVYQNDSLQFWANHGTGRELDYERVRDFIGLSNTDLSRVARVKKASVRLDDRIPPELKERLMQIANCCLLVAKYFEDDVEKTATWFRTANPMLGDLSPKDMIRYGRFAKLQRFITEAVTEADDRGIAAP